MRTCAIIPPRHKDIHYGCRDFKGYMPECIRIHGHWGTHVFKTPDSRYFQWEDDMECGCCDPAEPDRCYWYGEVTKDEAEELIKKRE